MFIKDTNYAIFIEHLSYNVHIKLIKHYKVKPTVVSSTNAVIVVNVLITPPNVCINVGSKWQFGNINGTIWSLNIS